MARQKLDGIIQAVHYKPNGEVEWVRTYLRRGPTFSDYILLDRQTLIDHLKAGKKYFVGDRVPRMASTFEFTTPVRVVSRDGEEVIIAGETQSSKDCLEGVPVI